MIYLEVSAEIIPHKMIEFNQSKMSFIDRIQHTEGYTSFTEKPGTKFQIKICWNSRKSLDAFMKSPLYRVFHGSIITLSANYEMKIINDKSAQKQINQI